MRSLCALSHVTQRPDRVGPMGPVGGGVKQERAATFAARDGSLLLEKLSGVVSSEHLPCGGRQLMAIAHDYILGGGLLTLCSEFRF